MPKDSQTLRSTALVVGIRVSQPIPPKRLRLASFKEIPSVQPPSTRLAYLRLTSRAIILANYPDNIIPIGQLAMKGPPY